MSTRTKESKAAKLARLRALIAAGAARTARLSAELSYGEVGDELDCSPTTVFRWERGERTPRGDLALRYLALLDELMRR